MTIRSCKENYNVTSSVLRLQIVNSNNPVFPGSHGLLLGLPAVTKRVNYTESSIAVYSPQYAGIAIPLGTLWG